MKILQIYNKRQIWGGEDYMVDTNIGILKQKGESVVLWIRRNSDLVPGLGGKVRAFFGGIYSLSMRRAMTDVIEHERPDVVHAHNLYPFFSPSVLYACRQACVPVVLHCHGYYLTCPTALHLSNGEICERCTRGREYWCVLKNCRGDIFESTGYALRSAVARKLRLFANNVTLFIALTDFGKQRLVDAGFPRDQVVVLPNVVLPNGVSLCPSGTDPSNGKYVAYIGRLSREKGVETFLAAAKLLPQLKFRVAGTGPMKSKLGNMAPENVTFVGWLNRAQLSALYGNARLVVVPSVCFETFGLSLVEAMMRQKPTVSSRIGALAEIADDGITGLLFEPGNAEDLTEKIRYLWDRPELCRKMGQAGREKALREYSPEKFYERLMAVYEKAIELSKEMCAQERK